MDRQAELRDKPFYRLDARDADKLLVVFAHRDADDFAFMRVTDHLPCSRLFLRDPSMRGWYNGGIPGIGRDIGEVCAWIGDQASRIGARRIYTIGSSMGAYAALLFGALLDAEQVLAFNPQTLLDNTLPLSPPDATSLSMRDLAPLIGEHRGTRFDVIVSEDDAVDLFHVARLAPGPHLRRWLVGGSSHYLTDELAARGELRLLLARWLADRPQDALTSLPVLDNALAARTVVEGVWTFMQSRFGEAFEPLEVAVALFKSHPGLSHFLAVTATELGRDAIAIQAARNTLLYRPSWAHSAQLLKTLLRRRMTAEMAMETRMIDDAKVVRGMGESLEAALFDALRSAVEPDAESQPIRIEVVAFGADSGGAQGARSVWVDARVAAPKSDR